MQPKNYWKDKFEDIMYSVKYRYHNILNSIRYRTTRRYYIVNSGLKPGYYDTGELILHVNFKLLVDFVEIEKAWMNTWTDDSAYSKLSWFQKKFCRFRSPQDGIAYLNWEINESQLEHQTKSAKEILELYTWWKVTRPNRPDPYIEAGYDEVFKDKNLSEHFIREEGSNTYTMKPFTKKESAVFEKVTKIENKYEKEDEKMLIRLMKIRKSLWT